MWVFKKTGNHILPDEDLAAFHWSLLGPEHPLASLKVLIQSVISHIFIRYFQSSVIDDSILEHQFNPFFSFLLFVQVRAHQLVLPPCEVVIKAVSEYVASIKDLGNLDSVAKDVFKQSQVKHGCVNISIFMYYFCTLLLYSCCYLKSSS